MNSLCSHYGGPGGGADVVMTCGVHGKVRLLQPSPSCYNSCYNSCSSRYLTLQRVNDNDNTALDLFEVEISSTPVATSTTSAMEISTCPSSYEWAYAQGTKCCSSNLERTFSQAGPGDWTSQGGKGRLHYDSTRCASSSTTCSTPPCVNYNFMKYDCYLRNQDILSPLYLDGSKKSSKSVCYSHCAAIGAIAMVYVTLYEYTSSGSRVESGDCHCKGGTVTDVIIAEEFRSGYSAFIPCFGGAN